MLFYARDFEIEIQRLRFRDTVFGLGLIILRLDTDGKDDDDGLLR